MCKHYLIKLLAAISNSDIILQSDTNGSKSSTLASQHSAPHIKRMDPQENDIRTLQQIPPISDSGRLKQPSVDLPYRPRASIEPFQVIHLTQVFCQIKTYPKVI